MAKFLDNTGLSYFVDKLKSKFVTQSEYGLPIYYVETGDAPSGSATYRLDNIVPEQTITTSTTYARAYGGVIQNYTEIPQVGEMYLVTFDGTEYVCEGYRGDSTGYVIGEYRLFTSTTVSQYMSVPFACAYYQEDGFALVTRDTNAHTVKVDKLTFIDEGETFTIKTITQNGTYSAEDDGYDGYSEVTVNVSGGSPALQSKTATPTTSQQTITPDSGYDGLSQVTVNAMPSGTEGTPTAAKGSVSNHSVTVTPSVTNSAGYISGGTKTGTGVSVSASELVSGSQTITENGTVNVTNLETVVVSVSGGGASIDTKTLTNDSDTATSLAFTDMKGTPKAFFLRCTSQLTRSSSYSYYYVTAVRYNGTNTRGNYWRRSNGTFYNDTSHYSFSYSGTTLTISSSASRGAAGGSFYNGNYELVYIY